MAVLRKDVSCPLFGHGRDLPQCTLPTYEDIMLSYLWISGNKQNQYKNLVSDTCLELSKNVIKQWQLASIPTIGQRAVIKKLKAYHDKYRTLLKPYASRKDVENYRKRIARFKKEAKSLFDIASCKCKRFESCICEKHFKVPLRERDFLIDQRGERKMGIGNMDLKTTKRNLANISRKRKLDAFREKEASKNIPFTPFTLNSVSQPIPSTSTSLSSQESNKETQQTIQTSKLNDLTPIAKTLDRFGVSDRAGAAIVSATLQSIGLISEGNLSDVIDRNKIRRARSKQRITVNNATFELEDENIGLYFDGRKDKTLIMKDRRRMIISEEHISLLKEPGSQYIGHLSMNTGRAATVSKKLKEFLDRKGLDYDKLIAIGCDGTVVNTGSQGGVIRHFEVQLGKPLQWCICQLHANELPLRHIFEKLDGSTTGPRSFTGPIGKSLKDCEQLPLVPFKSIQCTLPIVTNSKDFSTDQLYLYEMCLAINSGLCSESLSKNNPGKVVHSRWLTTANRILRLYVSSSAPSTNLLVLTIFIMKVYAPMWFSIKTQPLCIYGAKHLHQTIKLSRYLSDDMKAIIDPVIQRNGYFGHPENILIAMLADERETIRVIALQKLLKARKTKPALSSHTIIRTFMLPKFDFEAENYEDLINWNNVTVTEPPLTKFISDDLISKCIEDPKMTNEVILPRIKIFPCHTQATERCVKIVTEASAAVCGPLRRDGFIKTRLESRKIMPVFNTKKEYKIL